MVNFLILTTLVQAMRSLGLNPSEQEVIDIPNYITRRGLIYLADFCQMILKWFREDASQEEHFKQLMFRVNGSYQEAGRNWLCTIY